tara:strand:- start:287 stop:715 length:429 start_codon:yes stop_codon:yes gene_type:complete
MKPLKMSDLKKCPACGFSFENNVPTTELLKQFTKETREKIREVLNIMTAHHQYDGPHHYKLFLQGISNCEEQVIDSVCREWLAKKLYVTKSLAYLRGWMVRENERHINKQKERLATYGCQPPIIEERKEENGTKRNGERNTD